MITGLRITDFQSIGKLDVDCGRITVFHGESDTGKSAIVRALYALAFNSYPTGHVRDGAKHSEVEVTVDDVKIRARKGSTTNLYELDHVGAEMLGWDKVGTDVPPEVTNQLGWRTIELDDGSRFTPNFSLQFDPPFLLTDSPSKRAKVLGSLTNVATLFAAIKMANTWERRTKNRIEAQEEIVDRVEEQIEPKELAFLAARDGLEGMQAVLIRAKQTHLKAQQLTIVLAKALAIGETHTLAARIVKVMDASDPELDRIDELIPRIQGLQALYENVMGAQARAEQIKAQIWKMDSDVLVAIAEVDEFITEHEMCPMCGHSWEIGHEHE
jgi:hypothetical protein